MNSKLCPNCLKNNKENFLVTHITVNNNNIITQSIDYCYNCDYSAVSTVGLDLIDYQELETL